MLDENVKKRFGLALKNWRKKSGISQEELAWRAQLHRTYVSGIETGDRNPSLQSIEKLAQALNLSFSTLFQPLGDSPDAVGKTIAVDGKRSA
jgi:transcriptional regulator with XRE-family HTH domain